MIEIFHAHLYFSTRSNFFGRDFFYFGAKNCDQSSPINFAFGKFV